MNRLQKIRMGIIIGIIAVAVGYTGFIIFAMLAIAVQVISSR